ncbi:hypothetical protein SAMN05421756_102434 [Microlunatus flavus]|uniref:Uncharacterized protein n=2 Tax=Microlunatus flavus TaxID=1036181 RepID=A0A1H9D4F6_9ACTN|nr:hypothetical protein SAMN05421756_102434 [Microlunatus flavus]
MYGRSAQEAKDVERQLAELRTLLGLPPEPADDSVSEAQAPTSLVEIRGQIRDVAQWATDASSTAESLLRSRARLATAPPPAVFAPLPAPLPAPRAKSRLVIWLVAATAVLVVIVVLTVLAH